MRIIRDMRPLYPCPPMPLPCPLTRHLKNCSAAQAVAWAQTWLDQHPGQGELSADAAAEEAAEAGDHQTPAAALRVHDLKAGVWPVVHDLDGAALVLAV